MALKSGKHVYCEKPVGVTPAQVKLVVDAARFKACLWPVCSRSREVLAKAVAKIHEGVMAT
jgi:predicted dehydrogenase